MLRWREDYERADRIEKKEVEKIIQGMEIRKKKYNHKNFSWKRTTGKIKH